MRTGTEQVRVSAHTTTSSQGCSFTKSVKPSAFNSSCPKKSLSDYLMNSAESLSLGEIMEEIGCLGRCHWQARNQTVY